MIKKARTQECDCGGAPSDDAYIDGLQWMGGEMVSNGIRDEWILHGVMENIIEGNRYTGRG